MVTAAADAWRSSHASSRFFDRGRDCARANEMARNKSSGFEPDAYLAKLFTAGFAVSDLKDWLLRLDSLTSNPPVNGRKKKR